MESEKNATENKEKVEYVVIPKKELEYITSVCKRLDEHITFINSAYSKFQYPLEFISKKINGISGGGKPRLK